MEFVLYKAVQFDEKIAKISREIRKLLGFEALEMLPWTSFL